jgi:hypothetical protein
VSIILDLKLSAIGTPLYAGLAVVGRIIITSVALISAAAVSPTFKPKSRDASRVIIAVTV